METNPEYSCIGRTDAEAEAPILWPAEVKTCLIGKDPEAGKDWRQTEKGTREDEMVGWHHRLTGHEFEQALGAGERQGSLVCCGHGVTESWTRPSNRQPPAPSQWRWQNSIWATSTPKKLRQNSLDCNLLFSFFSWRLLMTRNLFNSQIYPSFLLW